MNKPKPRLLQSSHVLGAERSIAVIKTSIKQAMKIIAFKLLLAKVPRASDVSTSHGFWEHKGLFLSQHFKSSPNKQSATESTITSI